MDRNKLINSKQNLIMSINLMDLLKSEVGSQLAGPAAAFLGESESATAKAMGGILPSILGGLMDKGQDQKGAGALLDMLGNSDAGLMDNLGSIFGGGNAGGGISSLLTNGSSILGLLFGNNKLGSIIDLVTSFSGMKKSSSSSLLKLAAPFIMSFIGKKVKTMGLDALGLSKLLGSQKDHVASALPAGFGNALGFASLGDSFLDKAEDAVENAADTVKGAATSAARTATRTANAAGETAKAGGNALLKWLVPALLVAGLAFFLLRGCGGVKDAATDLGAATEKMVEKTGDAVGNVADKAGEMASDAAGKIGDLAGDALALSGDALKGAFSAVNEAAKATWDGMKFVTGSIGDQLSKFVSGNFSGDNRFTFTNLTFATGSANIDAASAVEVDQLAQFLKAYTGVKVIVEGYTDNTGDAANNQTLSLNRADAVKARLVQHGIAADRIATQGYGSANPVASNDTAEGRAQNRRIELRIIK